MTFKEWVFKAKHIPGSINIYSVESIAGLVETSDEIVIYCIHEKYHASITAYRILEHYGFQNVRRYAGGLMAWEAAGYPLEGTDAERTIDHHASC